MELIPAHQCEDMGTPSHVVMLGNRAMLGRQKCCPLHQETTSRPDQFAEICGACSSAPPAGAGDAEADAGGCFPAINHQALPALSRANAAPSSETRRKAITNDSSIARLSAACASPPTLVGMVMPASLVRCASIACCTPGDRCSVARWLSRLLVKTERATIPKTAMASSPAARETALLIPEAIPAWRCSTAPITAVVSGATVMVMPNPITTTAGKKVIQ